MNLLCPPAPNWYSSQVLDSDFNQSVVAIATRNSVTLYDANSLNFLGELRSYDDSSRIVCLKFHPGSLLSHLVATASANGMLKIWDYQARRIIVKTNVELSHASKWKSTQSGSQPPKKMTLDAELDQIDDDETNDTDGNDTVASTDDATANRSPHSGAGSEYHHKDSIAAIDFSIYAPNVLVGVLKSGAVFTWFLSSGRPHLPQDVDESNEPFQQNSREKLLKATNQVPEYEASSQGVFKLVPQALTGIVDHGEPSLCSCVHDAFIVIIATVKGRLILYDFSKHVLLSTVYTSHDASITSLSWLFESKSASTEYLGTDSSSNEVLNYAVHYLHQNHEYLHQNHESSRRSDRFVTVSDDKVLRIWKYEGLFPMIATRDHNGIHTNEATNLNIADGIRLIFSTQIAAIQHKSNVAASWLSSATNPLLKEYIVTSSPSGELCLYKIVPKSVSNSLAVNAQDFVVEKNVFSGWKHSKPVFGLIFAGNRQRLFSISMDGQVGIWNAKDIIFDHLLYSGSFGYIQSIDICKQLICIGSGDGFIRFLACSSLNDRLDTQKNTADSTFFQSTNNAPLNMAVWSPPKKKPISHVSIQPFDIQENTAKKLVYVAYASDDGTVGVLPINFGNESLSITFDSSTNHTSFKGKIHEGSIHRICWTKHFRFYTLGVNGQFVQWTLEKWNNCQIALRSKNVTSIITSKFTSKKTFITAIDIDYETCMAVLATNAGQVLGFRMDDLNSVEILTNSLKLPSAISLIRLQKTRNKATLDDGKLKYRLALVLKNNTVIVCGMYCTTDSSEPQVVSKFYLKQCSFTFAHRRKICDAAWGPAGKFEHCLMTSSEDCTVQIWDVQKGEGLSNLRGHTSKVLSCSWSDLEPGKVISGGEDYTARLWDIERQSQRTPPLLRDNVKNDWKGRKTTKEFHVSK